VLPVVFVFLLGIVWFGRAFNIYSTIQQAAQQGAIVAARPVCATCGAPPCSVGGTSFACDATVNNAIFAIMQASNLDRNQILINSNPPATIPCPNPPSACSTTDNVTICREVLLNVTGGANETPLCGAIVTFQYPFQFYLPFTSLNLKQIILTAQAQSRMEN